MSSIQRIENECAICGMKSIFRTLLSTNTIGSSDLDFRPSEMKRSTMDLWIQECPNCGYISEEISDKSNVEPEWLKSDSYSSCNGIDFVSKLAKNFYKQYMIAVEDGNTKTAFFALLHAAWACDDANDDKNSDLCRKMAIPVATSLIESDKSKKEIYQVIRADMMRRAGLFDELIKTYTWVWIKDKHLKRIVKFERKKAKIQDSSRYTFNDVL